MRFGNKELSKKFGRRAGVATLLASTAAGAVVGAATLGMGQASAAPGLSDDNPLSLMDSFAQTYAQQNWPDDPSGRVIMTGSGVIDGLSNGTPSAIYMNPDNSREKIMVWCAPGGCHGGFT